MPTPASARTRFRPPSDRLGAAPTATEAQAETRTPAPSARRRRPTSRETPTLLSRRTDLELDGRHLAQACLTAGGSHASYPVGRDDHGHPSLARRGRKHRVHGYSLPQYLAQPGPYRPEGGRHPAGVGVSGVSRASRLTTGPGHRRRASDPHAHLGFHAELPV